LGQAWAPAVHQKLFAFYRLPLTAQANRVQVFSLQSFLEEDLIETVDKINVPLLTGMGVIS
jgi:hypothetical protein